MRVEAAMVDGPIIFEEVGRRIRFQFFDLIFSIVQDLIDMVGVRWPAVDPVDLVENDHVVAVPSRQVTTAVAAAAAVITILIRMKVNTNALVQITTVPSQ